MMMLKRFFYLAEGKKVLSAGDMLDTVVGIAPSGVPLATLIAAEEGLKLAIYLPAKHSRSEAPTGSLAGTFATITGQRCIIIDDVVTTGTTLTETIEFLREHGATPVAVWSLFDKRGVRESAVSGLFRSSRYRGWGEGEPATGSLRADHRGSRPRQRSQAQRRAADEQPTRINRESRRGWTYRLLYIEPLNKTNGQGGLYYACWTAHHYFTDNVERTRGFERSSKYHGYKGNCSRWTTLGPRNGQDAGQPSGDVVITNDGATIPHEMSVQHPAKLVIGR